MEASKAIRRIQSNLQLDLCEIYGHSNLASFYLECIEHLSVNAVRVCIAVSISISPFLSKPSKHVLPESPKQPLSTFNMTTSSLEGYQVIHPLGFVTLSVLLKKLHFWSPIHHDYAILVSSFNCAIPRYHSVAILISIFQLRDFGFQVLRLCNYSPLNIPIVTIMMRNWNLVDQNCT